MVQSTKLCRLAPPERAGCIPPIGVRRAQGDLVTWKSSSAWALGVSPSSGPPTSNTLLSIEDCWMPFTIYSARSGSLIGLHLHHPPRPSERLNALLIALGRRYTPKGRSISSILPDSVQAQAPRGDEGEPGRLLADLAITEHDVRVALLHHF